MVASGEVAGDFLVTEDDHDCAGGVGDEGHAGLDSWLTSDALRLETARREAWSASLWDGRAEMGLLVVTRVGRTCGCLPDEG